VDLSGNIPSTATTGLGVDVFVATGIRRAGPGLIADVVGSAALLIALTVSCFGQGASDFTKDIDPLFAGVLAHPGNLGNTIQYAAASANRGDIESAISAYEQLRFYNPKLAATRFQLGVLYYQLGSYDQARGYLQTALQMPDVTPELRQKH
jgi:tetratricopeptide (TPR) repeat protein